MNFDQARFNMVEQQIRTWEVLDQRILSLVGSTPRERFVPVGYERLAYADTDVPLPDGQCMLCPKLCARILQALQVTRSDLVLEVGTGSGYLTALLADLGRHVVSIEQSKTLHERAQALLAEQGTENVSLYQGDGSRGWPAEAPYDVIVMTGSIEDLDDAPVEQLAPGGRLFAVAGKAPAMEACLVTHTGTSGMTREGLFETVVPCLVGAQRAEEFVL